MSTLPECPQLTGIKADHDGDRKGTQGESDQVGWYGKI